MDKHDVIYLFYHSFNHAQGRLVLQVDVLSWAAAFLREQEFKFTANLEQDCRSEILFLMPPYGHQQVDIGETVAQMQFWWDMMWDIFRIHKVVASGDDVLPITENTLKERALRYSGEEAYLNNRYSSLRSDKMGKLVDRVSKNDPCLTSSQILIALLLPNIISVETYFQGEPRYSDTIGRKRVDGSDNFECRLYTWCSNALAKKHTGKELTLYDELYLNISIYLDMLIEHNSQDNLYADYHRLIELYNQNHPLSKQQYLHR